MIPSEEIDRAMCQPKALIDAMEHLNISLNQTDKNDLFGLRRREIMYLTEERDYYNTPKIVAEYDLERANYALEQFDCIAVAATLFTLDEFLKAANTDQAILAKIQGERGQNHLEHVRNVGLDGHIIGNTNEYDWSEFEQYLKRRAEIDGFNVIFVRRKDVVME